MSLSIPPRSLHPLRRSRRARRPATAKQTLDQPASAAPERGTYVEVATGPARGARGRVITAMGGSVTLVTTLLGQRPLLLTVASTACATIPPT